MKGYLLKFAGEIFYTGPDRTTIIIPMFKKETKKNLKNCRDINLIKTTFKITTKIVMDKINCPAYHREEQQGFRSGGLCINAIFIVRRIIEIALELRIL